MRTFDIRVLHPEEVCFKGMLEALSNLQQFFKIDSVI